MCTCLNVTRMTDSKLGSAAGLSRGTRPAEPERVGGACDTESPTGSASRSESSVISRSSINT